ncbi:CACNA1H, partial [Symbiodinium sp. KB8]
DMLSTSQMQLAQLAAKVEKVQKMHREREKTVESLGIGEEVRETTESVDETNITADAPQVMATTSDVVQAILQRSDSQQEANNKTGKTHYLLEKVRQSHKPTLTFKALPPIEKGFWPFLTALCKRVTMSYYFECIISLVIVANSAMLGVESQMSMENKNLDWASQAEACFIFVYTIECILRAIAERWGVLRDGWFIFDVILVISAYVEQIYALVYDVSDQQVMVLRAMRLIRLVRTFRMIKQIRSIWRLVYGLVNSGQTMISTYALLFLVLYVFGVLALELISNDETLRNNEDTREILSDNFSSLGVTMITLTQFATMDSIADIYLPLTKQQPYLALYFFLLMAIVSISLMNLVTAVIVEGALEHARQDREEEQKLALVTTKQMLPEIVSLFDMVDKDSSGEIILEEMREFELKQNVPPHILDRASVDSMTELFEILDV